MLFKFSRELIVVTVECRSREKIQESIMGPKQMGFKASDLWNCQIEIWLNSTYSDEELLTARDAVNDNLAKAAWLTPNFNSLRLPFEYYYHHVLASVGRSPPRRARPGTVHGPLSPRVWAASTPSIHLESWLVVQEQCFFCMNLVCTGTYWYILVCTYMYEI